MIDPAEARCHSCEKGNHEDCVLPIGAGECVCRWCEAQEKRYGFRPGTPLA